MNWLKAIWRTAAVVGIATVLGLSPASAHPHVWVTVQTEVVFDAQKRATALRHAWTFDEMYTSFAVQGLGKKTDNPTREDLKELADLNIQSLKEFEYFTKAKSKSGALKLKDPPPDHYLELKDGLLTFHFSLPLDGALADADALSFNVTDPSYFIAFVFAKDKPVSLGPNAPKGCTIKIREESDTPAQPAPGATPARPTEAPQQQPPAGQSTGPLPGPAAGATPAGAEDTGGAIVTCAAQSK